ncbi:hypothetical protein SUGI_0788820 [Cryptomeria japonica]|nr:hypothetical protein SUGI_0788820 [Cryptomeria japonica]
MEPGAGSTASEKFREQTRGWVPMYCITVNFAAVFQIPGGVDQNTGIPVRKDRPALKVFIVFNALALSFSKSVIVLVFYVHKTHLMIKRDPSGCSLDMFTCANCLVQLAFVFTALSYSSCLFVLDLFFRQILAILVCFPPFFGIVLQMLCHNKRIICGENSDGYG